MPFTFSRGAGCGGNSGLETGEIVKSRLELGWRRDPLGIGIGVVSFAASLALAWHEGWRTTDLVWGLWLSSLVVGYVTLLAGMIGLGWRHGRERAGVILPWLGAGFFSLHFFGLHWLIASVLPMAFPLEAARGGVWRLSFWTTVGAAYWPVVALTFVARGDVVLGAVRHFDEVSPYLNLVRLLLLIIPCTMLGLLGYFTGLFTIDQFVGYAFVSLVFFSPWRIGRDLEPVTAERS